MRKGLYVYVPLLPNVFSPSLSLYTIKPISSSRPRYGYSSTVEIWYGMVWVRPGSGYEDSSVYAFTTRRENEIGPLSPSRSIASQRWCTGCVRGIDVD
ncbi:hypothetical protein KQX54_007084 [Cotesia glomerata]|uniref:Uncharacterized protein n=1 Tax=Cotesia glomerata TaxID=32391 RepID=A0AAV7J2T6_COTGL|nr:hypothetical protein KQX54_007084 [Cotesia glomerata]